MQLNAGQTVQCMSAKPSPLTRLQAAIRVAGRLSSLHSLLAASIPLKLWVTYESLCQEAKGVLRGVDEVRMMEHPPMPQAATIKSLPAAFRMMKAMQAGDVEWGEDYRASARHALAELLEGRMGQLLDEHLERMAEVDQADRRNGYYARWLLTELGMIELHVPRTRTFSALKVVRAYARRAKDVDRMILACFRPRALDPQGGRRAPAGARPPGQPFDVTRAESSDLQTPAASSPAAAPRSRSRQFSADRMRGIASNGRMTFCGTAALHALSRSR